MHWSPARRTRKRPDMPRIRMYIVAECLLRWPFHNLVLPKLMFSFFSQWATKPPASGYGHSLGYLGRESRNVGTQLGQIVKAMHPNQKQFVSKLQKKVAETCHELELVVSRSFQCMEVAT